MNTSALGHQLLGHKLTIFLADIAAILLSYYVASTLRLGMPPDFRSLEFFGICAILVLSLFIGNGYTSRGLGEFPRLPMNTFFVVLAAGIPCTIFIYLMGPERFNSLFGRGVFPAALIMVGVQAMLYRYVINRLYKRESITRRVLILGCEETKKCAHSEFLNSALSWEFSQGDCVPENPDTENLDAIVVAPEYKASDDDQKSLLRSRLAGLPIFSLTDFYERFLFIVPVDRIDNKWFVRAQGFTMLHSQVSVRLKRVFDVFCSFSLFVLASPLLFLGALVVKLGSSGPIIFSQTRVGIHGKPFTVYKLRTMVEGAEKEGAQWAAEKDMRVIPLGTFLRKSRIDEIPQCINILKGEMSFIGPRPERPEFTSLLAEKIPYYDLRHIVRPGLTGWAQVSYPYGASVEDSLRKLQFDLYYIKNHSLLLDLNIILRTVKVMLARRGR